MNKLTDTTERIFSEDALKHIYECEQEHRRPTMQSVAGSVQITLGKTADLLTKMASRNLLQMKGEEFQLTDEGRDYALQIVRAHRLWERYLADETGFAETEWHELADRHEHSMSPTEIEALAAKLGHPTHDPHGDPIPTAKGEFVPHGGQPLTVMSVGDMARIVHLEDEPETVYAQIVAEGLYVGLEVRLTEISPERIRFRSNGNEYTLAPVFALNISAVPLPKNHVMASSDCERLTCLEPGQSGKVVNISPTCRGPERRRFMDLGILPGTLITAEMRSPSGDPTAYRIRGALIALRHEQGNLINVKRKGKNDNDNQQ